MASRFASVQHKVARTLMFPLLLAFCGVAAAATAAAAAGQSSDTFRWSAELVSVNEANLSVTLKTRLDGRVDLAALEGLTEGDEVLLSWTGITWGAAISGIHPQGDLPETANGLVIPVEFVGTEMDDQYLLYRVPVPQASFERVSGIAPGTWVTAYSAKETTELGQAVLEMRGYNDLDQARRAGAGAVHAPAPAG